MLKRSAIAFVLLFALNIYLRNFVLGDDWKDGNLLVNLFMTVCFTAVYMGIDFCVRQLKKQIKGKK